ncbi:MAG TPA: hypothetical protein VMQ73_18645 [Methylomirabilota bacterium]|nr:hypothetical protein [Methylomirabilota bacterium]
MKTTSLALLGFMALCADAAAAEPDPNWPCQQPLVQNVTAAMIWSGPPLDNIGDWHSEPTVEALVERIAPRNVSTKDGQAAIEAFLRDLKGDRKRLVTLAFAGLLDETNDQRTGVIGRIKDLAERQRNLSELVNKLSIEVGGLPPSEQTNPSPEHKDLVDRWTFTTQAYTQTQQTMRYACEIPGQIDSRLGVYARALAAGLS